MWNFEPTTKKEHYRKAFEMYFRPRPFLRANCAWAKADEDSFIEAMDKGLNFAGFENGEMTAFVQAEPKSDYIAEGHLFCLPTVTTEFISALVSFAKIEVFRHYPQIITQILSRHSFLREVMRRSGFYYSGLNAWNAVYRGKLMESHIYIAVEGK